LLDTVLHSSFFLILISFQSPSILRFFPLDMKFNSTIAAAILAATTVVASPLNPLVQREGPLVCPKGCIPESKPDPIPGNVLKPSFLSLYNVGTGAINFDVPDGKIFKADNNGGQDITTLVTFDFPELGAKTCYFTFDLDTTATVTGSGQFDVFTSLQPATEDTTSWPPGNGRKDHVGRMQAVLPGSATWIAEFIKPFPCPTGKKGFELVGVNDNVLITWSNAVAGPRIHY